MSAIQWVATMTGVLAGDGWMGCHFSVGTLRSLLFSEPNATVHPLRASAPTSCYPFYGIRAKQSFINTFR